MIKSKDRVSCKRCGKEWTVRKDGRPDQCPKCKRTDWDEDGEGKKVAVGRGEARVDVAAPVKVESERDKRKREEAEVKRKLAEMKEGRPFGPIEG